MNREACVEVSKKGFGFECGEETGRRADKRELT